MRTQSLRVTCNCFYSIVLHGADDLIAADLGKNSDPYAVLQCDGAGRETIEHKTQVVKNSLQPRWEQSFTFGVHDAASEQLRIDVLDWDRVGAHDKLGSLVIPLAEIAGDDARAADGSVRIEKRKFALQGVKHGSVLLSAVFKPKSGFTTLSSGVLVVKVNSGADLEAADMGGTRYVFVVRVLFPVVCFCQLSLSCATNHSLFIQSRSLMSIISSTATRS
jgi:hypothetical protein